VLYALLVTYLVVGLMLGSLAVRRHRTSPVATFVTWMAMWPLIFALARVQNPPPDMQWPYRPRHLVTFFAVTGGVAVLALGIAHVFAVSLAHPLLTLFGLEIAFCALYRPFWFWNDPQMHDLRFLVGDRLTLTLYFALAATLIWLGLFTDVQMPSP
jgi:hypothetical protein